MAVQDAGGHPGRVRLCRVPDRTAASLQAAVRRTIDLSAVVHTDDEAGYTGLRLYGYRHRVVRVGAGPDGLRPPLPMVRRVVDRLNDWLVTALHGGVQASHTEYYPDEFAFRCNHRWTRSRGRLFFELLRRAAATGPVPAKDIRGWAVPRIVSQAPGESEAHSIAFPLPGHHVTKLF